MLDVHPTSHRHSRKINDYCGPQGTSPPVNSTEGAVLFSPPGGCGGLYAHSRAGTRSPRFIRTTDSGEPGISRLSPAIPNAVSVTYANATVEVNNQHCRTLSKLFRYRSDLVLLSTDGGKDITDAAKEGSGAEISWGLVFIEKKRWLV